MKMPDRDTEYFWQIKLWAARHETAEWRLIAAIGWGVAFLTLGANVAAWLGWLP